MRKIFLTACAFACVFFISAFILKGIYNLNVSDNHKHYPQDSVFLEIDTIFDNPLDSLTVLRSDVITQSGFYKFNIPGDNNVILEVPILIDCDKYNSKFIENGRMGQDSVRSGNDSIKL